jgi:hypothetical protein
MHQAAGSETKTTGRDGDYGRFCNFMCVVIKKKGQLLKQPTVNDCLPYEKEVVVGVFVFRIRAMTLSFVDDVKLHTCPLGSDTAFLSGYDLKDPDCALKRCPVADFDQKTH